MGFLFKGFSKKGEWYFRNTIWDWIIMAGAMIVFSHSFFTMEYIPIYSIWDNETMAGYGIKMGVQVIIAPMIIFHRIVLIILGEYRMPKIRAMQLLFRYKLLILTLKFKIQNENEKCTNKQKHLVKILWLIAAFCIVFIFFLWLRG